MSEVNHQCKISKRLDLRIQDLGYLEELLTQQHSSGANRFYYTTLLGETLKFVRVHQGLWLNEDYNITIRVSICDVKTIAKVEKR